MSDTYTLYNETVMEHFMNPRNMGDIKDADGVGEVGAAACGDIMKISLKIKDGKIEDARFKTFGCGSAIASSSMATELIKGRTISEAMTFSNQEVVDALGGLPPVKIHCSVLAEEALKAALEKASGSRGQSWGGFGLRTGILAAPRQNGFSPSCRGAFLLLQ
jgi:nitrogen fixation NifU-like protein